MRFKDWKIRTKLLSSFLILMMFIIALGTISFISITKIVDNEIPLIENNEKLIRLTLELRKNEKDFFLGEETNLDFYKSGKSEYVNDFEENYIEFQNTIEEIRKNNLVLNNSENIKKLDEISKLAKEYHDDFMKVVEKKKLRGFNDYGLVGELRGSVHKVETTLENLPDSYNLQILMLQTRRTEKDYFLRKDIEYLNKFKANVSDFSNLVESSDYDEEYKSKLKTLMDNYEEKFEKVVTFDKEIGLKNTEGLIGTYRKKVHNLEPLIEELYQSIVTVIDEKVTKSKVDIVVIIIAIVIISFGIVVYISGLITKPVKKLVKSAEVIASGNLNEEITVNSKDEIGKLGTAFKLMQKNLRELLEGVQSIANDVTASSQELAATSEESGKAANEVAITVEEMNKGTDKQRGHIEETSDLVLKFIDDLRISNQDAKEVTLVTDEVLKIAATGKGVVNDAIDQMEKISTSTKDIEKVILGLSSRSIQIGNITEVISNISEQTNLLALNAAIEAARAGEQGRGFAVVADEIRKLAEESQNSSNEISGLITQVQEEIEKSIVSMKKGNAEVHTGKGVITRTGDTFEEIIASLTVVVLQIQEVADSINRIQLSGNVISESIKSITDISQEAAAGVEQVSSITEEQTAIAEEVAASANNLANMSMQLLEEVKKFNV